jgi:hypothetical protein
VRAANVDDLDDAMSDDGRISAAEPRSGSESEGEPEAEGEEAALDEERVPGGRLVPRSDAVLRAANTPVTVREIEADRRATSQALTAPEAASLVAMRAAQIDRGGAIFIDLPPELVAGGTLTAERIALLELQQRRTPLLVRRTIYADGVTVGVETINPREAALPPLPDL